MSVLVVSNDQICVKKIKQQLENSYKVIATPYERALKTGAERIVESIIIDIEGDFAQLVRNFKADPATIKIPIIAYCNSANVHYLDFSVGFNDFIVSPGIDKELILRIRQQSYKANLVDSKQIKIGDLIVDFKTYEVTLHGKLLDLTFKEYELLKHLVSNPGQVFSRQSLLNEIWGYDYFGGTRTVDTHVARLRSKLGYKYGKLIETVQSVGYRFKK